jgi:hypothetical protein
MSGRSGAVFALLCALLCPSAGPALASVTTHPVPLQTSDCSVEPGKASSIGGHVLFEYVIEPSGVVDKTRLLYADVHPPEAQPAFVTDIMVCLGTWRFKPATVDGAPAATLMKVAFHRLPPTPADAPQIALPGGRTVPVALVEQMRSATLLFTESLLKGPEYKEASGNGWRLRTDLPKTAIDDVQGAIEFARRALDEILPASPGAAAVPPDAQDVTLILFKDQEKYRQLSAFDNVVPERAPTAGEYDPHFRLIYSAAGDKPMVLFARVTAHEATHHFLSQRWPGPARLPRWLNEGMAQFIESLKTSKSGKVRLDVLDRGSIGQNVTLLGSEGARPGYYLWRKRAEDALPDLRDNLAAVDPAALLDGTLNGKFFNENQRTTYDVSWLLVHFLVNGDDGRHREAFRAWMLDGATEKTAATLAAATGIPAAELRARLRDHLARLH